MEKDFETNNENAIEFLTREKYAVVSFTSPKHINRIKKIYEERGDDFKYLKENTDGSVCAKIPLKWVKISPPKQMSEEAKQAASERFKKMREEGKI